MLYSRSKKTITITERRSGGWVGMRLSIQRLHMSANEMINKAVVAEACGTRGRPSLGNRDQLLRLF